MQQTFNTRIRKIDRVREGDPLSASRYNQLVDTLNHVIDQMQRLQPPDERRSVFELIQLEEDIAPHERDRIGSVMEYDTSIADGTDAWVDSARNKDYVTDSQGGVYLTGERRLVWYKRGIGKQIIIPGAQLHLAKMGAQLNEGSSASATIWQRNSGNTAFEATSPAITVTAYDWLLQSGDVITSGTKVVLLELLRLRIFVVIAASCP